MRVLRKARDQQDLISYEEACAGGEISTGPNQLRGGLWERWEVDVRSEGRRGRER